MKTNRALRILLYSFLGFLSSSGIWTAGQEQENNAHIHVVVNMVQLNAAVTDSKGNYVTGLRPQDFAIFEDGIPEKIATFSEGNEPARRILDVASADPQPSDPPSSKLIDSERHESAGGAPSTLNSMLTGANVFILFDTSNYMYRGFVFAQDAIADFVRSLETVDKIAFYSYSRDLSRSTQLTSDRSQVLRGIRTTVAGDDAALYNCLLLTVKDAARFTGKRVVVVFSNGPDNSSVVPPEDVAELAQSTGTAVYMISTQEAKLEPISTAVFERMTAATGGKAYFAKNWRDEKRAFASIRDDLGHLYSFSYYPQPNSNRGWRAITVKLVGDRLKKYHIRTRNGYRPEPPRAVVDNASESTSNPVPD
jgi:Ca-activated chloride channel homolog